MVPLPSETEEEGMEGGEGKGNDARGLLVAHANPETIRAAGLLRKASVVDERECSERTPLALRRCLAIHQARIVSRQRVPLVKNPTSTTKTFTGSCTVAR